MKKLLKNLLEHFGKSYEPDPDLPNGYIFATLVKRLVWAIFGIVRFQRLVFVSPSATISGASLIKIGRFATIERFVTIDGYASRPVAIGSRTKIGAYSVVSCTSHMRNYGRGIEIGSDCGTGEFCYFGAAGGITIGDDVIMGQYVSFHSQNHIFSDPERKIKDQGVTSEGITLGNNIWVGAKVTFLDGSIVGSNSVVAAGAVVTGKFPPGVVIGGVPARILKKLVANTDGS